MDATDLEECLATTRAVLAKVTQDDMSKATPCASWTVKELVGHIVGTPIAMASMVRHGKWPEGLEAEDYSAGDFLAVYDDAGRNEVAAFSEPGVMERAMPMPFGDIPGALLLRIAAGDTFAHGWDLAKAIGQSSDLNPDLATRLLESAREILQPAFRGGEPLPFGPEVTPGAGASAADRLAAFLGRTP